MNRMFESNLISTGYLHICMSHFNNITFRWKAASWFYNKQVTLFLLCEFSRKCFMVKYGIYFRKWILETCTVELECIVIWTYFTEHLGADSKYLLAVGQIPRSRDTVTAKRVMLMFTYAKSWRVHFAFVFPHVFYIRLLRSAELVIAAVFARGALLTEPHKYMS